MKTFNVIILGIVFFAQTGCANELPKSYFTQIGMPETLQDRSRLVKLLYEAEILNKDRSLVHLSHTCNLVINNHEYPVINTRELVKGAMTPRGVNQIVVLNYGYQLVKTIEYSTALPLFCEGNKIYLHGDLIVDGFSETGNVLVFEDDGYQIRLLNEDLNKKLPL